MSLHAYTAGSVVGRRRRDIRKLWGTRQPQICTFIHSVQTQHQQRRGDHYSHDGFLIRIEMKNRHRDRQVQFVIIYRIAFVKL